MIERIYFIALILNVTGLFRFIAPQIGVSIGMVTQGLLALNLFYLMVHTNRALPILLRGGMGGWLLVLLLWPLFTLLYAPMLPLREVGIIVFHFTLFFGTVVFVAVNGLDVTRRLLGLSLLISLFGMGLSKIMPGYFDAVSALADTQTSDTMGRAFGFQLQPNALAFCLIFLFVGWFSLFKHKNSLLEVGCLLILLLTMLFTGSRAGIVLAVVVIGLSFSHSWSKQILSGRYLLKISAFVACLLLGVLALKAYILQMEESDLRDRMQTLLSFNLSKQESIVEDRSVQDRLEAQASYVRLIAERPIVGHGLGADNFYKETGRLGRSAHSALVTCAMEYGIPYTLVYLMLVFQLYRRRRLPESVFRSNSVTQFTVITALAFAAGHLVEQRPTFVLLGYFVAVVYCRQYLYENVEGHWGLRSRMTGKSTSVASPPPTACPPQPG